MEWKLEYSVGDEDLDRDHMSILNALDRVKKAQKNNLEDDFIGILLTQLVEYVDGHFAKEEEYMAKIGFPDFFSGEIRHQSLQVIKSIISKSHCPGGKSSITSSLFLRRALKNQN